MKAVLVLFTALFFLTLQKSYCCFITNLTIVNDTQKLEKATHVSALFLREFFSVFSFLLNEKSIYMKIGARQEIVKHVSISEETAR